LRRGELKGKALAIRAPLIAGEITRKGDGGLHVKLLSAASRKEDIGKSFRRGVGGEGKGEVKRAEKSGPSRSPHIKL